jgi:hypothetical protein
MSWNVSNTWDASSQTIESVLDNQQLPCPNNRLLYWKVVNSHVLPCYNILPPGVKQGSASPFSPTLNVWRLHSRIYDGKEQKPTIYSLLFRLGTLSSSSLHHSVVAINIASSTVFAIAALLFIVLWVDHSSIDVLQLICNIQIHWKSFTLYGGANQA